MVRMCLMCLMLLCIAAADPLSSLCESKIDNDRLSLGTILVLIIMVEAGFMRCPTAKASLIQQLYTEKYERICLSIGISSSLCAKSRENKHMLLQWIVILQLQL